MRSKAVAGIGEPDGTIAAAFAYDAASRPTIVGGGSGGCVRGDVNGDGSTDGQDIQTFVDVILGADTEPNHVCAADIDVEGGVVLTDLPLFVQCLLAGECAPLCLPGDVNDDGLIDVADIGPFVAILLAGTGTGQKVCATDLGGPHAGPPDGILDGHDIQALVNCLVLGDCPPPGGGGGGEPATTDNTFFLHGAIVDALDPDESGAPRLQLQYNRARYYDLRHARWLQRDPTGYTDGGNLYEGFGGNPARNTDPLGLWIPERLGEILGQKGSLTIGDIKALAEEMYADPAKQIGSLTENEIELLWLLGGDPYGIPFSELDLSPTLKGEANRRFAGLAEPYRSRAMATLATRRRILWILVFQNPAFAGYVTDTYRLWRDVNPVTFLAERSVQITTGTEGMTGQRVSRIGAATELVLYLALGYAAKAGPPAITGALGGAVPRPFSFAPGVPLAPGPRSPIPRAPAGNRSVGPMSLESGPGTMEISEAGGQLLFPFARQAAPVGGVPAAPRVYSVAFETRLAPAQMGLNEWSHYQIANQALQAERAANPALAELVSAPVGWGRPPAGWTWQHATIQQGGGRAGVLQLVPRYQHTPGSPFWSLFHPLPGGAGGYWEWAVPAGARPR